MNFFNGLKNPFATKSSSELESEKTDEMAKLSASYDEKIAAAKEKEGVSPDEGTTTAVGGRRRKTRRGRKSRKSRKARK